jgi:hypothetical protein
METQVTGELVLLVEPDGASWKLRPFLLKQLGIKEIIEQNPTDRSVRTWKTDGEVAQINQPPYVARVFREVVAPIIEPAETPLFDELVLKDPLDFHGDETPLGFRRKHLRTKDTTP